MKVLVTGGRDFKDYILLYETLNELHNVHPFSCLIHGDAAGADRMACGWAVDRDMSIETYKADWKAHGKAAGPIRNQRMLDEGRPDLVVAFPGGRGTRDMVRRARKANIEVREIA